MMLDVAARARWQASCPAALASGATVSPLTMRSAVAKQISMSWECAGTMPRAITKQNSTIRMKRRALMGHPP